MDMYESTFTLEMLDASGFAKKKKKIEIASQSSMLKHYEFQGFTVLGHLSGYLPCLVAAPF